MPPDQIVFLHFNDVYHISQQEKIARFLTQLEVCRTKYSHLHPYTVFSGDVFSPSLEASILRGAHMLPILRELKVDLGCYGNHDFDFGEDRLRELRAGTDFPWLLSNVHHDHKKQPSLSSEQTDGLHSPGQHPGRLLADAAEYHTATLQGYKIGFFGLAGTDWPSNSRELPPCTITPPVESARACSRHLRQTLNCDFVVAVTHMRLTEDVDVVEALRLAPHEERVDLLLGGHDHEMVRRLSGESPAYSRNSSVVDCMNLQAEGEARDSGVLPEVNGAVSIIKSGSDWESISCVRLHVRRTEQDVAILDFVTAEQIISLDKVSLNEADVALNAERVAKCLESTTTKIEQLGADPLAQTVTHLEGAGSVIRSRESNLGNMLADMLRAFHDTDIAFVNSGSVRCNRLIHATMGGQAPSDASPLTVRDLIDILPFGNQIMVKRISGDALLEALENSFSDAHTDGRFLHYSGLTITADWSRSEWSRVLEAVYTPPPSRIHDHGQKESKTPSTRTRIRRGDAGLEFTVAMIAFIADGFDGYTCFKEQETLIDEEESITDTELLLRTLGYAYGEDDVHNPKEAQEKDTAEEKMDRDNAAAGYQRARDAIISGWDEAGLPVLSPQIEGRIVAKTKDNHSS